MLHPNSQSKNMLKFRFTRVAGRGRGERRFARAISEAHRASRKGNQFRLLTSLWTSGSWSPVSLVLTADWELHSTVPHPPVYFLCLSKCLTLSLSGQDFHVQNLLAEEIDPTKEKLYFFKETPGPDSLSPSLLCFSILSPMVSLSDISPASVLYWAMKDFVLFGLFGSKPRNILCFSNEKHTGKIVFVSDSQIFRMLFPH